MFAALFSSRWLLQSLGKIDYGLYGLVGGLTFVITFLNTVMSTAYSRFYAIAEGERQAGFIDSGKKIQEWFNTAFLMHSSISTILLILLYPIGVYMIRNVLNIPADRVAQCVWVLRFSCLSSYFGMLSVPFSAMFIAKQRIAEYTIYNMIAPLVELLFAYYITLHQNQWLVQYAFTMSAAFATSYILICVRAVQVFPECRPQRSMLYDRIRTKRIINFSFWQCFGNLGSVVRSQGMAMIGNVQYGPEINSSLTISNRVYSQADSLAASLRAAFAPAITNAYGARDFEKVREYTSKTNKIGAILVMIMGIPISLEINKLLELWLKDPPAYTSSFCILIIASLLIDKTTSGFMLAINASGRVALYQGIFGVILFLALPLAHFSIKFGIGVLSIGYAHLITTAFCSVERLFFAKRFKLSWLRWVKEVLIPVLCVCGISSFIGYIPQFFYRESISRLILTFLVSEVVLTALSWFFILNRDERHFVCDKIRSIIRSILPHRQSVS